MTKILVVDDEQEICEMIKRCLERNGSYTVLTSMFPEEVVSLCEREQPDLMLLDIVMPNIQGTEIIKELKEKTIRRPLIIVTSGLGEMVYHEKDEHHWRWEPNRPVVKGRGEVIRERSAQRAAAAYGVEDYLAKPFSPQTLLDVIQDVLQRGHSQEGGGGRLEP